jgi:hypothetical protein
MPEIENEMRLISKRMKARKDAKAKMVRSDLIDLLRRLRANHPDCTISVSQMKSGEETKRLWAEVDAVLASDPEPKGRK